MKKKMNITIEKGAKGMNCKLVKEKQMDNT